MTQIPLADTRRLSAAGAVVLAFSLQICGCNPVPDCRRILQLQLSSLASEGLKERCAQCVTAQQMTRLTAGPGSLLLSGAVERLRSEATIQQALLGEERTSFYDPAADAKPSTGDDLEDGTSSISRSSPLRLAEASSSFGFTPWPIPESVFFLYRSAGANPAASRRVPIATAFILSVPNVDHRTLARFLVTARHVVDPEWAHCSNQNPASLEVGLSRRSGGVGYETVLLSNKRGQQYFVPEDGTSDLAIIRLDEQLIPDLDSYKFVDTPFRLLPTEAELQTITGAQEIVTANLRDQAHPELEDFPSSGLGVLPSIRSEPVDIRCGNNSAARSLRMWFIGGSVQQGVSGAPVYTSLVRNGQTTPTAVLLGVQSIAWPNRGVAGITPSSALAELVQTALGRRRVLADLYRGVAR